MPQFAGGDDTVGNLDGRHLNLLLADLGIEGEVELALLHGVLIGEGGLHRVVAAEEVRDGLVVAEHLLTLERGGLALDGLLCAILREAQFGDDRHDGLLVHILLWECAVDGRCDLSGLCLQGVWSHFEIVTCQLS